MAAKVFLQEAVNETKKKGVKLINIEDGAEPPGLEETDLLIRAYDMLLPPEVVMDYS